MYLVTCDGNLIHDPSSELLIIDPVLDLEDSCAGSFTFTIPFNHVMKDQIHKWTSEISVYLNEVSDDGWRWSGRITNQREDFLKNVECTCEGELACLNDTRQPRAEYHNVTVRGFLQNLMAVHNSRPGVKQFQIGMVTVTDSNNSLYRFTNRESTLACIKEKLYDRLGGHLRTRHVNGVTYIDYLADYPRTSEQVIRFGENLLDHVKEWDLTDLVTVVIPLGERLEETDIPALDAYLTCASVNNGKEYIVSEEAVARYGWVEAVINYDDVTQPGNLLQKGTAYLRDNQFDDMIIEVTAVDLSQISDADDIRMLDRVRVVSGPHGLDRFFPVHAMRISLMHAGDQKFVLGSKVATTMTSAAKDVNKELIKKISAIPTRQQILDSAKANATELIKNALNGHVVITENADELLIMDTDDIETATKVWRWNLNGIGYSGNGYNGNFGLAITMDGQIVADFITTGTLDANLMTAGIIRDITGKNYWNLDTGDFRLSGNTVVNNEGVTIDQLAEMASGILTVNLSNEYQGITVDAAGRYTNFPECKTTVKAYHSALDVTANCSYSISKSASVTGSWDSTTHTYTVTGLSSDTGYVDISVTYLGKITNTKRLSLSKVYSGADGTNYILESSHSVIKKGNALKLTPNMLTFSSFSISDATRTSYDGLFLIEESYDSGSSWTTIYESEAPEHEIKHSLYTLIYKDATSKDVLLRINTTALGVPRGQTDVRCTLKTPAGVKLAQTSVSVVMDDVDLSQEDVFNILTDNGRIQGLYMSGGNLYMNASFIKSGTMELGGANNTNGMLIVRDASGNVVGIFNNSGIDITKGTIRTGTTDAYNYMHNGSYESGYDGKTFGEIRAVRDTSGNRSYYSLLGNEVNCSAVSIGIGTTGYIFVNNGQNPNGYTQKVIIDGDLAVSQPTTFHDTVYMNANRLYMDGSQYFQKVSGFPLGGDCLQWNGNFYDTQSMYVAGAFTCKGTKNRAVDTEDYDTRKLYCYETATPYFGDIGEGITDEHGEAIISVDDIFSETVADVEYQVFIQKEGPGDIWVSEKNPYYFVVSGAPDTKFAWELKAVQRDYDTERLEALAELAPEDDQTDYYDIYADEFEDLYEVLLEDEVEEYEMFD